MQLAERIAARLAGSDAEAEDMSHAPIDFDGKTWDESRLLVSAELTRHAENIHDLRDAAQSQFSDIGTRREHDITRLTVQREADLARIDERFTSIRDRVASLDTRIAVWSAFIGFAAGIGGQLMMAFFFRK